MYIYVCVCVCVCYVVIKLNIKLKMMLMMVSGGAFDAYLSSIEDHKIIIIASEDDSSNR